VEWSQNIIHTKLCLPASTVLVILVIFHLELKPEIIFSELSNFLPSNFTLCLVHLLKSQSVSDIILMS
jgi:hypothetical protein